jgi:hypothetical protein
VDLRFLIFRLDFSDFGLSRRSSMSEALTDALMMDADRSTR